MFLSFFVRTQKMDNVHTYIGLTVILFRIDFSTMYCGDSRFADDLFLGCLETPSLQTLEGLPSLFLHFINMTFKEH